ncbi:DUF5103 domain-containing protein [Aquimarina agarivorans]|uniref:type IX secretion system plug protein n=1 Tax=Aquimarina agarivorans TaxID=980584 RepID=UPI000248FB58|nr:DUF5103 domain-containing protein [Aquimarina agarivorans]
MRPIYVSFFFSVFTIFSMLSQEAIEIPPPEYIKTIQFRQNGENKNGVPLIEFGTRFEVNFDDIIGDEAFYYYKINYYNFDWTPTILSKNEYIEGLDNILIQDTENSLNSLQIYTHFKVQIPNQNTQALKKTGNYVFELYNDNEELVFSKKFIVFKKGATIQTEIERTRDFNFLNKKQIVQFSVDSNELLINPKKNLKVLVMQNNSLKTAITDLKSQYTIGNKFIYRYDKEASFWGGNEYWNFDNKDVRNATVNINRIELKDIYHNYLFGRPSRVKQIYTFFPDINGNFAVRNIDARNSDIEAEYVWLHFKLNVPRMNDKEVHIFGNFNNFSLDNSTLLAYDTQQRAYVGKRLFKQGFYNYKFVTKDKNGIVDENAICGNFDKTENEYVVIAYYRAPNSRNDSIIGIGSANSVNITN